MALPRVYTSRPLKGLPAQHRATIIVGDIVGMAPGTSVNVRITHSYHPDFRVGKKYLLCGKRLRPVCMDDDRVLDATTLEEITPISPS